MNRFWKEPTKDQEHKNCIEETAYEASAAIICCSRCQKCGPTSSRAVMKTNDNELVFMSCLSAVAILTTVT